MVTSTTYSKISRVLKEEICSLSVHNKPCLKPARLCFKNLLRVRACSTSTILFLDFYTHLITIDKINCIWIEKIITILDCTYIFKWGYLDPQFTQHVNLSSLFWVWWTLPFSTECFCQKKKNTECDPNN